MLADVAQEYLGVEGKLWLQKSGIGQVREKMQMAAGKMRTEKQFSKENEKKWLDHHLNKTGIKSLLRPSDENKMFAYQIKTTF